ncbi:MAG TPA: AI-2E family transporter [Bacteroidales bacterium]|nr:AI-2E family transporter [Bacteroidales bacterium]
MSPRNTKPFTLDRVVRIIIGILIVVAAGLLVNRLSEVLLPFLIAWLLAYLMYPLVGFFQYKLHFKFRIPSIIATLTTVFGALTAAIYFLIPPIIEQSQRAGILIAAFLKDPQQEWTFPPQLIESIRNFLKSIDIQSQFNFDNLEGFVKSILPRLWDVMSGASSLILNIFVVFVVLLYLIFILKDYEKITEGWINLIPKNYRLFVLQVGEDLKEGMNHYFRGQGLIALIVGILYAIGFSLVGLPLGIVLGLLVGVMHLVPYLQTLALIPAIMLAAVKSAEYHQPFFWVLMSVLAVFVVMQVVIELILNPKILGKAMGLHPAIILLSLSIWGSLFGVVGMIIALPMTTLIISYYVRFIIDKEFIEQLVSTPTEENEHPTDEKPMVEKEES